MALRSSISGLTGRTTAATSAPAEVDDTPASDETGTPGETAVFASVKSGRGRPRLSDEEKAARSASRSEARKTAPAAAPKPKRRILEAAAGRSAAELRAALRDIEGQAKSVNEQRSVALAKFQPKIDELRAKHAEVSAQLAALMFQ